MSLEVDSAHQIECSMKAIRKGYGLLCFRSTKNIGCEYDRRVIARLNFASYVIR